MAEVNPTRKHKQIVNFAWETCIHNKVYLKAASMH